MQRELRRNHRLNVNNKGGLLENLCITTKERLELKWGSTSYKDVTTSRRRNKYDAKT